MVYVLDTDHLSLFHRGFPGIRERIDLLSPDQIAIMIITAEEQLRGRLAQISKASSIEDRVKKYLWLQETLASLNKLPILQSSIAAGHKVEEFRRLKIRVGTQDLRIAAITLAHQGILVTRNLKDFSQIPGLTIENWAIGRQ
ncbi:MAG TPA: type II toxin-antitoxin system VapC family toxin [Acidobacteriota bacterium]|nr:type II toxin-antitoxin system VapC family toxin [Acidobacteriota bacterium]